MTNLASRLRDVVRDHPDAPALSVAGTETSYEALWAMTGQFAAGLVERGVEPGDPIALYLPNLPQFVVAFFGTLRAGGVVVPMNPQYKAREIRHLLTDSAAGAVVTTTDRVSEIEEIHEHTLVRFIVTADGPGEFSTGFAEFLDNDADFDFWELADRGDDDVAALPYTSGTTGDPKGVRLTHGNLAANTAATADLVPDGIGPDDAALGALPLYHIYGLTVVMNATLLGGGTFYPLPEWDAGEALSLVDDEDLTILHGVPAMYTDMLHHPDADDADLSSVRLAGVGGSGMPVEVLRAFEDRFDVAVHEGYGLTETSPVTHFNAPEWGRRVGSVGKPLPDVDARVVDEEFQELHAVGEGPLDDSEVDLDAITGELVVAGPNVMQRYHNSEAANEAAFTEADGRRWFHTGDVAYYDEDGYYYVVDRTTDVIVTGGYNVYPREVEEVLFEHPAVAEAAVVGVPDERKGETVAAFVVPAPDADPDPDALREHCLDALAEYKHPREVELVEELPRTSSGKVQKYRLRERFEADAGGTDAEDGAGADDGEGTAEDPNEGEVGADDGAAAPEAGDGGTGEAAGDAETVEAARATAGADGDAATGDGATAAEGDGDAEGAEGPAALEEISGVGPAKGETLREAGFDSVADVRAASQDELAEVEGVGAALAEQMKADVADDEE